MVKYIHIACAVQMLVVVTYGYRYSYESLKINSMVDFILAQLFDHIADDFKLGTMNMPIFKNQGGMKLGKGKVLGLHTIRRVGDTYISQTADVLDLSLGLKFANFTMFYGEFFLKLGAVEGNGTLSVGILENNLRFGLRMRHGSLCLVEADRFEFLKLSGFDIRITFEKTSKAARILFNYSLNLIHSVIKYIVQSTADRIIQSQFPFEPEKPTFICRKNKDFSNHESLQQLEEEKEKPAPSTLMKLLATLRFV